jgi:hypothetical protein
VLGVAYYRAYDENELRAVCFSIWSHFNLAQTRDILRALTQARTDAEQPWADGCISSSSEQFT